MNWYQPQSPYWQIPMPDYSTGVCPGCGRCHTCGRGGHYQYPHITWGSTGTVTSGYVEIKDKENPLQSREDQEAEQDGMWNTWDQGLDKDMD